MAIRLPGRWQGFAKRAALGSAGVLVVTVPCQQLQASFAVCGFLLLIVVLLLSLAGDLPVSVLVSVEALICLEYFFVEPRNSWAIAHGEDIITLLAFLTAALVVTRLVSRVSKEATSARLERQRQARLYRLAQQLLTMEPGIEITSALPERFQTVFEMTAAAILDGDTAQTYVAGKPRRDLASDVRQAYLAGRHVDDHVSGIFIRCLRVGQRSIGCIGFEGLQNPGATAEPLAALASTFLERIRALRTASETAAAAHTEVYRAAILDALAHEFKTPLATILAAAGGVREVGPLGPAQLEMVDTVETEAARLGTLTSRLLRMAKVERDEVRPRIEGIELAPLVEKLADQHARRSPDRRVSFLKPKAPVVVQADPELLRLAVTQLLENACKYSQPGSTISIRIEDQMGLTGIRVTNSGSSIQLSEQHRIFDRFYRGSAGAIAPGSGLGLYVARKIAIAHGGALDLDSADANNNEVSFRLTIPTSKSESDHVITAG
jgi:two-component system, OmpR family, sensor histidine kinase KdpD